MNNLNSLLLEGYMVQDPCACPAKCNVKVATFIVDNKRYHKQDGRLVEEVSYFDVKSEGSVAEQVLLNGHEGRGVRVVGWLKEDRYTDRTGKAQSHVTIVADHVEFRPEVDKGR